MLANATLRPVCKHFQSHRSPKEPSITKSPHYMHAMFSFVLLIKGYTVFCCKYQTHLQYMQKLECKCYVPYIYASNVTTVKIYF